MAIVLNQHDHIVVGFLGAPHGDNGWISLIPVINPATEILRQNFLLIKHQSAWRALELLAAEENGKELIVRFAGCDNSAQASQYNHCDVAIKLYHTPELPIEEYHRQQLIAEGHREFGAVAVRREERNPLQNAGLDAQNQAKQHPLLAKAVQFSGDDKINSPLATENEEAQKEFALELQHQLQLQHQQQLAEQPTMSTPKPIPR